MIRNGEVDDATLEYAAKLIEEASITDYMGIAAKRKRDREDAALRLETIKRNRADMAALIRAFKARDDLAPLTVLRNLSELPDDHTHSLHLTDAWPLAWKGWLNIECRIVCNSNCAPPESEYRIVITDKGREALNQSTGETS